MSFLIAASSAAHAAWDRDGSLLTPEDGALIVSDGRGGVFGATYAGETPRFHHLAPGGEAAFGWPRAGVELVPGNNGAVHESIHPIAALPDGEGGSFILAEEQGPNYGDGGFLDPVQLVLHHRSANGSVAPSWTAEGVLVESAWLDHRFAANNLPCMTSDGLGGVLIGWLIGGGWDPNPHAFVQRFGADGSRKWRAEGVHVCGTAAVSSLPTLLADGSGGALVMWAQWDSAGSRLRVYGQHVLVDGELSWGAEGRQLSTGSFDRVPGALPAAGGSPWVSHAPAISATAGVDGGATLCWAGADGADLNIFATRITPDGRLPWRHELVVCAAPGEQASVVSVSGRRGAAVIVWRDGRDPANVALFAQSVSLEGRPQWAKDGVIACSGAGDRSEVVVSCDGHAGAYVAWVQPPQGGRVFAQHLLPSGRRAPGWSEAGLLVSPTANSYEGESIGLQLVESPRGNAIAGWSSARVGSLAMLITPRGPAGSPPGTAPLAADAESAAASPAPATGRFALQGVRPNPASADGVVSFSLVGASPATLELVDLAGRRVWSRDVGLLGPGEHTVRVSSGTRVAPGIYFIRLTQGARVASIRATLLR